MFHFLNLILEKSSSQASPRNVRPELESLEERDVPSATADLIAFRPVTPHLNYANYRVAEANETDHGLGAGIRINGDDDNANGVADYLDLGPSAVADNDLIRVDVAFAGNSATVAYGSNLRLWTSQTKTAWITSGSTVNAGTYWIEYVSPQHTSNNTSAVLSLTATDGVSSGTDQLAFHSFQSIVVAIGGRDQNPADVGDSRLGTFTLAARLYDQGYDVQLFSHDQVSSSGAGAAFDEVSKAILARNVDNVAIFGYSWGGGATYELAQGLNKSTTLKGQYTLRYTAYIDAITHYGLGSERRLPPGTQYNDNIFQRRDWLLKGNTVTGANNVNVTQTSWGSGLNHTSIDDHLTVQNLIFTNLTARMVLR